MSKTKIASKTKIPSKTKIASKTSIKPEVKSESKINLIKKNINSKLIKSSLLTTGGVIAANMALAHGIPYLYDKYGIYAFGGHEKERNQYNCDYKDLFPIYKSSLNLRYYIDNELYSFRENYNKDKDKIKAHNIKYENNQITSLYEYITRAGFDHNRPI